MKLTHNTGLWGFLFGCCLLATSAACPGPQVKSGGGDPVAKADAIATLEARSGSTITGDATFTQEAETVRIIVNVKGATPGEHGLHIHEKETVQPQTRPRPVRTSTRRRWITVGWIRARDTQVISVTSQLLRMELVAWRPS